MTATLVDLNEVLPKKTEFEAWEFKITLKSVIEKEKSFIIAIGINHL
jgi:hypothetical protein